MTSWVLLALLLSGPDEGWKQAAHEDGVTVFTRDRPDSVAEMKAIGDLDVPIDRVWTVLWDHPNYKTTLPNVEESVVVARDPATRSVLFYAVINAPFIDRRDYVIRVTDETDAKDLTGLRKMTWALDGSGGPAPRKGMIRLKVNNGYWTLEPREGGKHTFATYYLVTDPGGSVPKWLVTRANETTIPNIFRAIRKAASAPAH